MPSHVQDWVIGIVEKRYRHPGAGRYTAFMRYLNLQFVPTAVNFRFFKNNNLAILENRLFRRFSRLPSEGDYPNGVGVMLQEIWTLRMMRRQPSAVFHSVKGEADMHNLPRWSRRSDARLAITFHDALDQFGSKSITADFLSNVDGILALCETQRSFFTTRMNPKRVRVVHHGVDTHFFHPGPDQSPGATVISVGSYCRDHTTFSAAIPLVWKVQPDVRFVIVGLATSPETMPDRIDDPRVTYLDGITDAELLSWYHRADLAAISLWAATANNAVLEAMACGLPVVATDIGGIPEYLGKEAGLLSSAKAPEAFAEAIIRVLSNPTAAAEMGLAGRRRAVEMFDYAVIARETQEFYDQLRTWPQAPAEP